MGGDLRRPLGEVVGPVQPALAMGMFLRVWCAQWGCLSRAQLANAVQSHLTGRKRVTAGVIRWWEAGQPPENAEELEALCLVMRAHDLTAPEVEQFRVTVFAACANRQYPALFEDDGFPYSPQVAEHAAAMLRSAERLGVCETNTVTVTACYEELRAALRDDTRPQEKAQRRKQQMALACLRALCSGLHFLHGRSLPAATEARAAAADLRTRFGPAAECAARFAERGLWLDADRMEIWDALNSFKTDGSPAHIERLVSVAQTARTPKAAHASLCEAITYAAHIGRLDLLEPVHDMVCDTLPAVHDAGDPRCIASAHRTNFWMALAGGRIAEAEQQAAQMEWLNQPDLVSQAQWNFCMGRLEFARKRYEAARDRFLAGLRPARLAGISSYESQMALDVKTCERRLLGAGGGPVPPFHLKPARRSAGDTIRSH